LVKKTKHKKKSRRKPRKKTNLSPIAIGMGIIIVAVILIKILSVSSAAATVNGEKITEKEVNEYYDRIPEQYQQFITKSDILDQIVSEKILLQEASKQNIAAADNEVDGLINDAIQQNNLSQKEFEQRLKEQGLSLAEMKEYYKNQLTITKLLNKTIFANLNSSDQDAVRQATQLYLEQLKANSEIEIFMSSPSIESIPLTESTAEIITASATGVPACLSDYGITGNTIIFIHSNSCPHCQKMMPIVKELEQEGYTFYWAESSNQEASSIVNSCLSDLMTGYVPQFICPSTGQEKTGEMSKSDLKTFADNCK